MEQIEKEKYLEKLEELAKEAESIHSSTDTSFSLFTAPHNFLRSKYLFYYKWHLSPISTRIHIAVLLGYVAAVLFVILKSIVI